MKLSESQYEIVYSKEKYSYVLAGAGSGKTRTLTEKVKLRIAERNKNEKILALTFSNKAANELKERLLLDFTSTELAEYAYVGTIHNFCMEIIISRGSFIGLGENPMIFDDYNDRFKIFLDAVDQIPTIKSKCYPNNKFDKKKAQEIFNRLSNAKKDLKFPIDFSSRPDNMALYQKYDELLKQQNSIDFDDILLFTYRILVENKGIAEIYRSVYKSIFVDEAQDLNMAQYAVIKVLAGESSSIFMVGDPIQSIYGFNGSSSRYMCQDFPNEFNAKKFILNENYRSSRKVLDAARKIDPDFELDGQLAIEGHFDILEFENENMEASWIISEVLKLNSEGFNGVTSTSIPINDIAILARARHVFNVLENLLIENKIEYHVKSSSGQGLESETKLFRLFDLSLLVISNCHDSLHFKELLELIEIPEGIYFTISDIRESDILTKIIRQSEVTLLKKAWDLLFESKTLRFAKIIELFRDYLREYGPEIEEVERNLLIQDYYLWCMRWENFVRNTSTDDRNLQRLLRDVSLGVLYSDTTNGLTLSTVHMSKGLEFDVVIIMGMNEKIFPDYRSFENPETLEEERHAMFVSITRAKQICYLTYPKERIAPWGTGNFQPSRFIRTINS